MALDLEKRTLCLTTSDGKSLKICNCWPWNVKFLSLAALRRVSSRTWQWCTRRIRCLGGALSSGQVLRAPCARSSTGFSSKASTSWSSWAVKSQRFWPCSLPSFTQTILKFWRLERPSRSRHFSVTFDNKLEMHSTSAFSLSVTSEFVAAAISSSQIDSLCVSEVARIDSSLWLMSVSSLWISPYRLVFTSSIRESVLSQSCFTIESSRRRSAPMSCRAGVWIAVSSRDCSSGEVEASLFEPSSSILFGRLGDMFVNYGSRIIMMSVEPLPVSI